MLVTSLRIRAWKRIPLTIIGSLILAQILALTGCRPSPPQPPSNSESKALPSILWITIDTLRRDAVGAYGSGKAANTPVLDNLAQKGILFEQAVVPIPTTLTSHTAMFSGRTPRHSGVRSASDRVPDSLALMAEILKQEGYQTAAFVSASVLNQRYNLGQGFEHYDDEFSGDQRSAQETVERAAEWLENNSGADPAQPVFLWLHLFDPHSPYDPPSSFARNYVDPGYAGPIDGSTRQITQLNLGNSLEPTQADLDHLRSLYLAEVEYADFWIGRFLEHAQKTIGSMDDTIVIALADHGENLGEHGLFFHGFDLFDPCITVPAIISWPEKLSPGRRISEQIRTIDLMPSLLALLGIPTPLEIEGTNLAPAWLMEQPMPELMALLETEHPMVNESDRLTGLRTSRWKYLARSMQKGPPVLFSKRVELPLMQDAFAICYTQMCDHANIAVNIRFQGGERHRMVIRGERLGQDPIHQSALDQGLIPASQQDGPWRMMITPNLRSQAKTYAEMNGWPMEGAIIEAVGIELTPPPGDAELKIAIDDFLLILPGADLPSPPAGMKGEPGKWVLEDFAKRGSAPFSSPENPRVFAAKTGWMPESALQGEGSQGIHIGLRAMEQPILEDALFDWNEDPDEATDLLTPNTERDVLRMAEDLHAIIAAWVDGTPVETRASPADISAEQMDKIRGLGYVPGNQ
jgi:arylsulfatase A-like enzyme